MEEKSKTVYDKTKEKQLVKWKLEIGRDQWSIELVSYDGANGASRPKLRIKRWYVGKDEKWHYADPELAYPYEIAVSIVSHAIEIEKAYETWKGTRNGKGSKPAARQDGPPV